MAMLVVRMDGWGVIPQTNSSSWPLPKDCNLKRGKLQVKTAPATGGMSAALQWRGWGWMEPFTNLGERVGVGDPLFLQGQHIQIQIQSNTHTHL